MPETPELFSAMEAENLDSVLDTLTEVVYRVNVGNGWFTDDRRPLEDIALLHSEASEACEEIREHRSGRFYEVKLTTMIDGRVYTSLDHEAIANGIDYPPGHKPVGLPSELADLIIRICDTAKRYEVDLGAEVRAKLAYNTRRGFKHGGKAV